MFFDHVHDHLNQMLGRSLIATHLKFENRSRTTRSRFLRSFAVPDKAVVLLRETAGSVLRANTRAHQHTHTHHKTRQDKTRQDKTRQDKTRQDKTRQDKTRQDKTRQDPTKREESREERRERHFQIHVQMHFFSGKTRHPRGLPHPPPSSSNRKTIQYLIPGWTTIVKLLKQVKNWQSPSRDP